MSNQVQPPDSLEQWTRRQLQALPLRPAPRELSARVLAELRRRAALPWWRKSFLYWPVAARVAFVALCLGLADTSVALLRWLNAEPRGAELSSLLTQPVTWLERANTALQSMQAFFELVVRHLPGAWLYGGLLAMILLYVTLFGIGAAAYRTLYADR